MIDYGKGYSCEWRAMRVDPATWASHERMPGLLSASIERDSESEMLESGSASFDGDAGDGEIWCRLEMLAEQAGEAERSAVATVLLSPGDSTASLGGTTTEYQCRSALSPAADRVLLAGDYAPMGMDGAAYAAGLIAKCTPAPVTVEGSFTLSQHVVFAKGTTHLEAAWTLLDSAGWCVQIAGDGSIAVKPKPSDASLSLDQANASLLGTEVTLGGAMADVPNRYIAVDGEESAVAVNDAIGDPVSTHERGRYVDRYDESPQRVDGESLQAYAERKLAEASASVETRTYTREFAPGVMPFDIVSGSLASVGLDCVMRVKTQSLQIGKGLVVTETSEVLR